MNRNWANAVVYDLVAIAAALGAVYCYSRGWYYFMVVWIIEVIESAVTVALLRIKK